MCTIWLYTSFTYLVTLVTLAIDLLPHLKPRDIFSFAKKLSHRTKFSLLFHRRESFLFGHSKIHFHTLMDGFHHTSIYFGRTHTHARIHEIFFNEELLFIQIDLHTLLLIQHTIWICHRCRSSCSCSSKDRTRSLEISLFSIFIQILLFCYSRFFAYCDFSIHQYNKWSTQYHTKTRICTHSWVKLIQIFSSGGIFVHTLNKTKKKHLKSDWIFGWVILRNNFFFLSSFA